jgi:hypothetical protein
MHLAAEAVVEIIMVHLMVQQVLVVEQMELNQVHLPQPMQRQIQAEDLVDQETAIAVMVGLVL